MGGGWGSEAESQLLPTFTAFPRKKTNTHTQEDSVPKPTTLVPKSVSLDRGRGGEGLASVSQMKCPHSSSNFSPAPSLVVQGALAKCHQTPKKGRETSRVLTCRTPTPPRVWQGWRHSAGSSPRCPRRWCSGCPSRAEARSTCPETTSKLRRAERCSERAPHRREGVRVEAEEGGGGGAGRGGRRRTWWRIRGPSQSWQSRYGLASGAPGSCSPRAAAGRGWFCRPLGSGSERRAQRHWMTLSGTA